MQMSKKKATKPSKSATKAELSNSCTCSGKEETIPHNNYAYGNLSFILRYEFPNPRQHPGL